MFEKKFDYNCIIGLKKFLKESSCLYGEKQLEVLSLIEYLECEIRNLKLNLEQCENGYNLELHTARFQLHSTIADLEKARIEIAKLKKELL